MKREKKRKIHFLGTLSEIVGNRKSTNTDQYLKFDSPPLHLKLSVIRPLLDRCFSVVTEEKDWEEEVVHITAALLTCGYTRWLIERGKC